MHNPSNLNLILPVGTQVVTRCEKTDAAGSVLVSAGATGEIVAAPVDATHAYRVRLPDGAEDSFRRQELSIRKHVHREDLAARGAVLAEYDLYEHVIFRCVVGSRAYGLSSESSDVDLRGVYLPPAELHWSLYGVPEQLERFVRREPLRRVRLRCARARERAGRSAAVTE